MVILERVVMVVMGSCLVGLAFLAGYSTGYMQGLKELKDLQEKLWCLIRKYTPNIEEVS